ncbi:MAG: hypothetical protein ABR536_02595 [Solirubrobacterales bacterium]
MAARRLLIVMLIVLGVLTLATALAPQKGNDAKTPAETSTAPNTTVSGQTRKGVLLEVTIDADDAAARNVPRRVTAGDQLQLKVASNSPDQVEIPAFGQVQPVTRDAPAYFDLLLDKPGIYEVKLLEAGRVAGLIQVSPAAQPASNRGKRRSRRGSP